MRSYLRGASRDGDMVITCSRVQVGEGTHNKENANVHTSAHLQQWLHALAQLREFTQGRLSQLV